MKLQYANLQYDPATLPLRDIHLPAQPSWWPPAASWSLLALVAFILFLLLFGLYRYRQHRRNSVRHQASQALSALCRDYIQHRCRRRLLRGLSALLRRVAISVWPRRAVASLTGEAWLRFLDQGDTECRFSRGVGRVLLQGQYQRHPNFDVQALLALVEDWLRRATSRTARARAREYPDCASPPSTSPAAGLAAPARRRSHPLALAGGGERGGR